MPHAAPVASACVHAAQQAPHVRGARLWRSGARGHAGHRRSERPRVGCAMDQAAEQGAEQRVLLPKHNTSGYRGVHRKINGGVVKWSAEIKLPGETTRRWLGTFEAPADAARAYDAAALAARGASAVTNFDYSDSGADTAPVAAAPAKRRKRSSASTAGERGGGAAGDEQQPISAGSGAGGGSGGGSPVLAPLRNLQALPPGTFYASAAAVGLVPPAPARAPVPRGQRRKLRLTWCHPAVAPAPAPAAAAAQQPPAALAPAPGSPALRIPASWLTADGPGSVSPLALLARGGPGPWPDDDDLGGETDLELPQLQDLLRAERGGARSRWEGAS
ncbi:ERN3 [Scenedesmus sp. PABB004]|nr:ERN3 [Scenedesmus sp. PABB004]